MNRSGRQLGYARALLDRESTTDGGPLRFVAATEGMKADGVDLRMSGGRLDRYQANPIVGYGHNYWGRTSLPIGRAPHTEVDGKRLIIDVEFDQGDPFAVEVERKYRGGFLNAGSIGFDVLAWEDPKSTWWTGGVAVDWELFEFSMVPLPMDADAVVSSGRGRQLLDVLADVREGKVLSAANQQLVEDAMAALAALLDSAVPAANSTEPGRSAGLASVETPGAPKLAAARRRLNVAVLRG